MFKISWVYVSPLLSIWKKQGCLPYTEILYSFVAHNDEDNDDLPLEFHTPEKYILYTLESLTDLDIVELQYNSLCTAA